MTRIHAARNGGTGLMRRVAGAALVAACATTLAACGSSGDTPAGSTTATATTRAAAGDVQALPARLDANRAWEVCALGTGGVQEELQAAYYRGRGAQFRPIYAPRCDLNRPWARIPAMQGSSRVELTGPVAEVRIRPA